MMAEEAYGFSLLMLCIYREARGESSDAQHGVGWVIKNRVQHPSWMGSTYPEVILHKSQFSSFNMPDKQGHVDANNLTFPMPATDPAYGPCMLAAKHVYEDTYPDPTGGATQYFDNSIAANPPSWAKAFVPTVTLGKLHFFKEKL